MKKETILKFKVGGKESSMTPKSLYRRSMRSIEHNFRSANMNSRNGMLGKAKDHSETAQKGADVAKYATKHMNISPAREAQRAKDKAPRRFIKAVNKFKPGRAPGMYANEWTERLGKLLLEQL